ncbi:MAG: tRNA uridine-5-carboxymethylaminomethyl(34) synthesis GTPase MnmE [Deltaproteobacteria bacterium]|nr:MAG: tRNA uridine-5-carboxymethylaminomethyl(34) synthesis GTPase MnmE [Deltaproteobacteria bacterium]
MTHLPSYPSHDNDTIAAIATPSGSGAIGIIRISGPKTYSIISKLWNNDFPESFETGKVLLGQMIHLESKNILDQVLALPFRSPRSYTGEDLLEIHAHGNPFLLNEILSQICRAGARLAKPGEFTKRAFWNGKLDLIQAESGAELISSTNERSAKMAEKYLQGQLSEIIKKMRNDLIVLRAQMEAMIDFPEDEDVQGLYYEEISDRLNRIEVRIKALLSTYEEGRRMREGIRVAIVGKPNVGKSSLFNALLQENRAIVHSTPGTTRDLIEECLDLEGLMVRFIDTAGIRDIDESVESEGIRRAQEKLKAADLVLAVFDTNHPFDEQDKKILSLLPQNSLSIFNKSDLDKKNNIQLVDPIFISAKTGEGIDSLKRKIIDYFNTTKSSSTEGLVLINIRHRVALERALKSLEKVQRSSVEKLSLEFLVSDLNILTDELGEITGEITNDEILGEIFSNFCIGK